ncbi:hypothetical protein GCM10023212_12840 [Luteolibacter yonseiensis]|nr:hypothetical protein [Luteolibacter yonseiensis]
MSDVQMPPSSGQGPIRMTAPKVSVPTAPARRPATTAARPQQQPGASSRILYPWKLHVTCTIFWIGEQPTDRNPTPNCKSSWDQNWSANFGGYDNPDPTQRIANHTTGDFRPKNFIPKLNPFYIALPYNDVLGWAAHKPEASRVIPWFGRMRPEPGKTVCKGRWVQIYNGSRSCYAQWEDCGPWVTDDWEFVFGNKPPKATQNGAAGIDISPSVRDYLGMRSGQKVHWRFVEDGQVPYGPWKKYGQEVAVTASATDLAAQQRYLEYVRKLRDEQFLKKPTESVRN